MLVVSHACRARWLVCLIFYLAKWTFCPYQLSNAALYCIDVNILIVCFVLAYYHLPRPFIVYGVVVAADKSETNLNVLILSDLEG